MGDKGCAENRLIRQEVERHLTGEGGDQGRPYNLRSKNEKEPAAQKQRGKAFQTVGMASAKS